MTPSIDDHADRFDEKAESYDESKNEEYRACASLVVEHATPDADDTVLDLGTGTGAIALALAADAGRVVGRDISEGMLDRAREKAREQGIGNVEFGEGRFREPDVPGDGGSTGDGSRVDADTDTDTDTDADTDFDIVTSNFAMHHLSDAEKREAVEVIAALEPRKFVLGDVMLFVEADPSAPFYSPEVDDPATVGVLADAFTDAGFALTAVERVHDQVGVLVGERVDGANGDS
jgi:SAM-dependent methyltransferase